MGSDPILNIVLKAYKPLQDGYPTQLDTLGDHLRKRRMDLEVNQETVAKTIGVTTDTVTNWELNRNKPTIQYIPKIIKFLGYAPNLNTSVNLA